MRQYVLILVYAGNDEIQELVIRRVGNAGLWILPNVAISWHTKQEMERRMLSVKEELISLMERGFEGEFAYAIIELNDEQFRAMRSLVVRKLESDCQGMITWGESLLRRIRSRGGERIRREYERFERKYRELVTVHEVFDVRSELLNKVMDLARELRAEYERKL